jgi:hypothetical protein
LDYVARVLTEEWKLAPDLVATQCLFGWDIDEQSVAVTQDRLIARLTATMAPPGRDVVERMVRSNIRVGNALTDCRSSFDLVLLNPPWSRFFRRKQKRPLTLADPSNRPPPTGSYGPNCPLSDATPVILRDAFHPFVELFVRVWTGGRGVLLVPDSFLDSMGCQPLRKLLLEHMQLEYCFTFRPHSLWPFVNVGCVACVCSRLPVGGGAPPPQRTAVYRHCTLRSIAKSQATHLQVDRSGHGSMFLSPVCRGRPAVVTLGKTAGLSIRNGLFYPPAHAVPQPPAGVACLPINTILNCPAVDTNGTISPALHILNTVYRRRLADQWSQHICSQTLLLQPRVRRAPGQGDGKRRRRHWRRRVFRPPQHTAGGVFNYQFLLYEVVHRWAASFLVGYLNSRTVAKLIRDLCPASSHFVVLGHMCNLPCPLSSFDTAEPPCLLSRAIVLAVDWLEEQHLPADSKKK